VDDLFDNKVYFFMFSKCYCLADYVLVWGGLIEGGRKWWRVEEFWMHNLQLLQFWVVLLIAENKVVQIPLCNSAIAAISKILY